MPVKFDNDSVTVSLPNTSAKKIELKYDSVISDYLNSATILGPIPIEPEKIEIKNMELEGLKACVEMLIERVTALNEENIQLKDRMTVLETQYVVATDSVL